MAIDLKPTPIVGVGAVTEPKAHAFLEHIIVYTSERELNGLFSELGVELRLSDTSDNISDPDTSILFDLIVDATDTVNQYVLTRHIGKELELSRNRWVRRRATIILADLLSQRRGNPEQFATMYERAIKDLESVERGSIQIPRLGQDAIDYANYVVDYRVRSDRQSAIIEPQEAFDLWF